MNSNNSNLIVKGSQASINDYLRVMDVASAFRKERERVQEQFNLDDAKAEIRTKILKT